MEIDIKLSPKIIESMKQYINYIGHVAFLIHSNKKKIAYIGKSRPLVNYGNNHGICSIHAEKAVLENLRFDDRRYNLFVFRWNRKGNLAMSKPCLNCMKCLQKNKKKIHKVFYSIDNGITGDDLENMIIDNFYPSSGFRIINQKRKNSICQKCL